MNKKDNIFLRLIRCSYDIKSLQRYIFDGIGRAILYAALLIFILGGVKGIAATYEFNKSTRDIINTLNEDKYEFTIQDGVLSLNTSPLKFDNNGVFIYFDKDKTLDEADDLKSLTANADTYVLVLKDGICLNPIEGMSSEEKIKYTELSVNSNEKISNKNIIDMINFFKPVIIIMTVVMIIVSSIVSYLILGMIISGLTLLLSAILGIKLNFSEAFSLSMYTGTLPNILITLFSIFAPAVTFDVAVIVGTVLLNYVVLRNMEKVN